MIITIDGPSASGKSTIARLLAKQLDYFYLNTGLLYRGFAYAVLHKSIDPAQLNEANIAELIQRLTYNWHYDATMHLDGADITAFLDQKDIDQAASRISALPLVRKHIDAWQHALADGHNSVVDGRDSGSVVFAHAEHKFYVTASDEVRAKRWLTKQQERGQHFDYAYALEQIQARDRRDMQRAVAPLVVPQGATVIVNDGDEPLVVIEQIKQQCFAH